MHNNFHVIVVFGGRDGSGKSVFSVNLALAMMLEYQRRVLLIDMDPDSCGDLNQILGARPRKTIVDLAGYDGKFDDHLLRSYITNHQSGLGYIGKVTGTGAGVDIPYSGIKRAMMEIGKSYPIMVVDGGSKLSPAVVRAMELASAVISVVLPDHVSVGHAKRIIGEVHSMMFPPEMVLAVVNNFIQGVSISPQQVQAGLAKSVVGVLPSDPQTVGASINRGQPYLMLSPNSQISGSTIGIVRQFMKTQLLERLRSLPKPVNAEVERLEGAISGHGASASVASAAGASAVSVQPLGKRFNKEESGRRIALKSRILKALADDLKTDDIVSSEDPQQQKVLREKAKQVVIQLLNKEGGNVPMKDRQRLVKEILDEALALGCVEDLLADPNITEIMVNGVDSIYVEKAGKIIPTNYEFTSEKQLLKVIERILHPLNRRINEQTPYVDARLKDGSRVHAIIPPVALNGPTLTIRKFSQDPFTERDLVKFNSISGDMVTFLKLCVENKFNIVISGGTGSGKTTLLNVLSSFIPNGERIITVEDSAELQLKQDHVVSLEVKRASMGGKGEVGIRQLVKETLRMRPDRIVVGECRSGEALDMLQAMNTGHDGSLTTVHANTPRDCLSRLETLCLYSGVELPQQAIREQISSAVHLIVQISRFSDGTRKVTSVTEITGIQGEAVTMGEIFKYTETGVDPNSFKVLGTYEACDHIPRLVEALERRGKKIDRQMFRKKVVPGEAPARQGVKIAAGQAAKQAAKQAPGRVSFLGGSNKKKK